MMLERMTFMVRVLVIIFIISLGMLGTTQAATYYVSKSGSNNNSCATAQSPDTKAKLTIADGAACLQNAGDQLLIQAGTYNERMTYGQGFPWRSGSDSTKMTRYARASVNDAVIVKPSSSGDHVVATYQQQYIEIDGLIIDATNAVYGVKFESSNGMRLINSEVRNSTDIPSGNCVGGYGNGNQIIKNNIHNCIEYGIYWGGTNGLIEGNIIHDNGGYAIHHYSDGGGVNNHIIRNNIIYGNGFQSYMINRQPFTTPAVIIASGGNSQFYNNVVYNNNSGLQIWSTDTQVYNNTFYGNGAAYATGCIYNDGGYSGYALRTIIKNNICYQNTNDQIVNTGTMTQSNNLISGNPKFVSTAGADFRLQGGSPAMDAGVTIASITSDIIGTARPQGGAYDIGAYECSKSLTSPANFRIVSSN